MKEIEIEIHFGQ